jgi:uncharacterized RDD family membrane protein YckC
MIEGLARDSGATRCAGFWIRVAANVLDMLILGALNMAYDIASYEVFGPGPGIGSVSGLSVLTIEFVGVVPPLVIIGSWIALGASPGKLLLGLRIVDEPSRGRPSAWQCIGRYLMALLGILCAGLGFLYIAIDPRKQGWHDKILRTLVVRR